MIKKEDIKVGSFLQIRKADLEDIIGSGFIKIMDPNNVYESFAIKVVDMVDESCVISFPERDGTICVNMDVLAKVSVFANEFTYKKAEKVSHPNILGYYIAECQIRKE